MQVKNRGWVKNAIIIFLAIMLVLTFFSNTIMNYSLPEVSGVQSGWGSSPIKTAVRGQGTIVVNESHEVTLNETRQIAQIHVKAGDTVEAGQLLFTLEASESDELKAAVKTLNEMELALTKKLLQMKPADYDDQNREIEAAQEELQALIDTRDNIALYAEQWETAKQAVKTAELRVEALKDEQADIEYDMANLASDDSYDYKDLLTETEQKLLAAYEEKQAAEEKAQKAVDSAQADLDNASGSSGGGNVSGIVSQITAKQDEITDKKVAIALQLEVFLDAAESELPDEFLEYEAGTITLSAFMDAARASDTAVNAKTAANAYISLNNQLSGLETDLDNLQVELNNATSASKDLTYYTERLNAAKNKLAKAKEETAEAKKAFERGLKELNNTYKDKLNDKKRAVKDAEEALADAQAAEAEAKEKASTKPEDLEKDIKAKQREIEAKLDTLADKKDDDRITQAISDLDIQAEREAIEDQAELVETMRAKAEGLEVNSRYSGLLTSISCIVGQKVEAGKALASLDIQGKGYTTSFSVTNEQAQKVRLGETVTMGYNNSIQLVLTAIRADPESQGRRRILEFSVDGDVYKDQVLNITVGEQDAYYDVVLPNSAIREDADGTYILAAESKSTPLGNRYTAVRIDVTVLAKDDMNTAVSRDNYNGEFIITTATKPVNPGDRVRLVD